jgi:hypothetical protein
LGLSGDSKKLICDLCGLNRHEADLTPLALEAEKIVLEASAMYTSGSILLTEIACLDIQIFCLVLRQSYWHSCLYRDSCDVHVLGWASILCSRTLISEDIKGAMEAYGKAKSIQQTVCHPLSVNLMRTHDNLLKVPFFWSLVKHSCKSS